MTIFKTEFHKSTVMMQFSRKWIWHSLQCMLHFILNYKKCTIEITQNSY